jgi:hypothetical protein
MVMGRAVIVDVDAPVERQDAGLEARRYSPRRYAGGLYMGFL